MIDIKLPEEILELIDDCDKNCSEVENRALDALLSIEIPVFSILRHINVQKCYSILCRLREWFGSTPTKEHYLCLMIVTDYISCSYNNNDFYGTFTEEKKDKFYESFFVKLSNEWRVMFHKTPIAVIPSLDQFNALKNNLRVSISRFPVKFLFNGLLSDIMTSCNHYGSKLEKHLLNLKAKKGFDVKVDLTSSLSSVSTSNCNMAVCITSDLKSTSISIPHKIINKAITSNGNHHLMQIQSLKCNLLPSTKVIHVPKKIDYPKPSSEEAIHPPVVTILDDSPVKVDETQSKLNDIINFIPRKVCKRSAETCEVLKSLKSEPKIMKSQSEVAVSNEGTNESLPKKNAFDILMRKKVVKSVS